MKPSAHQVKLAESSIDASIFLSGPAGCGKTTAGLERLKFLIQEGVPGKSITVLVPQRNLGTPYLDLIASLSLPGGSLASVTTYGGLARRYIELFWPLLQDRTSLFALDAPPVFLTLESTLYYMASIVEPLINNDGLFSSITIQRNRLYSQILDNLNKAAVHGYSHLEISERLKSSWAGDSAQSKVFDDAQLAANHFRDYCLANNLLDFSLQIELFQEHLSKEDLMQNFFADNIAHLIYDNCEEDIPVCHDFAKDLIGDLQSALIIFDTGAGYRHFLGASPDSAHNLKNVCQQVTIFEDSFTSPPEILDFNNRLKQALKQPAEQTVSLKNEVSSFVTVNYQRHLPELAAWISSEIEQLIQQGVDPGSIVILSPYLSDSLRFVLTKALESRNIPATSHRPSRSLREEPATVCLLALAALSYPDWEIKLSVYELSLCFMQCLTDLDLTRANLLSRQLRPSYSLSGELLDFDKFPGELQERIGYYAGAKYQVLIDWLKKVREGVSPPLDHFIISIFGEILSQPGFGFHNQYTKAEITNQLVDSIKKFRDSAGKTRKFTNSELGIEYYSMVKSGVLANQYLRSWKRNPGAGVFISPAYTYLLSNHPVEYQFWIEVGSRGWYERIYQPLTNPHVLHRFWEKGKIWLDADEYDFTLKNLARISTGLSRRCRKKLYLCLTDTDERGYEQKGLLIQAVNEAFSTYSGENDAGKS